MTTKANKNNNLSSLNNKKKNKTYKRYVELVELNSEVDTTYTFQHKQNLIKSFQPSC